jgi:transcription elongation factor Elf1
VFVRIDISAFRCGQCENRITEQFPTLCQELKHPVQKVSVVKRFFECGQCGKRESSLSARKDLGTKVVLPPEVRCLQCGAFRWRPCGQRGSGPLSLSARDAVASTGAAVGGGANKLILSASEWSKSGDKVTMADRVSRL